MPLYDVIIIGSGPAGLTAAIYSTRANLKTLVIAGAVAGGQLMITTDVENYPGFPKGVQGPELMELWRQQAERFKADFVYDNVTRVDFSKRPFKVWTSDRVHEARSVIIATGANEKPGSKCMRSLRWVLLQRPRRRRCWRQRHGNGGQPLPLEALQERHGRPSSTRVPREQDHAGPSVQDGEHQGHLGL